MPATVTRSQQNCQHESLLQLLSLGHSHPMKAITWLAFVLLNISLRLTRHSGHGVLLQIKESGEEEEEEGKRRHSNKWAVLPADLIFI